MSWKEETVKEIEEATEPNRAIRFIPYVFDKKIATGETSRKKPSRNVAGNDETSLESI